MEIDTLVSRDTHGFKGLPSQHRGIVLKGAAGDALHREDCAGLAQEIQLAAVARLARRRPRAQFVDVDVPHRAERRDRPCVPPGWPARSHGAVRRPPARRRRARPCLRAPRTAADPQDFIRTRAPFERALLLYLEERSTREIAEVSGIGESNVATRISRLKQRLRDHVRSNHPEATDGAR